jgi:hypothetical protein
MAANKKFRFGPVALTATYTTNILNPPTATGGTNGGSSGNYILLYKIRVVNKTAGAVTYRLFLGATGANTAGTELDYDRSVAANSSYEMYFPSGLRIDTTDFLVGGASAGTSLTIEGEGEIGVAG